VTKNNGEADIWIVKIDLLGNIQWQKSFGGSQWDAASSIRETVDGGFIIAGSTSSDNGDVTQNNGSSDVWLIKLDKNGNFLWQKFFGGSAFDESNTIQKTPDGGFIIAVQSESNDGDVTGNHGENDFWILKVDAQGNIQWEKCFGGSKDDIPYSILVTDDRGFIIAGSSESNDGDLTGNHGKEDAWIVKLDSLGNIEWQKNLGGSEMDEARDIQETSDGNFIIAGMTQSTDGDVTKKNKNADFWIVKLDYQGNIIGQNTFDKEDGDAAFSIQETADGGFIVAGETWSIAWAGTESSGNTDFWVIKVDAQLNLEWQKTLGGRRNDYAQSVLVTSDGGYIIIGASESNDGDVTGNHGSRDFWLVKLQGELVSTKTQSIIGEY
jgi:hypothetical protein